MPNQTTKKHAPARRRANITGFRPMFSWGVNDLRRSAKQTAYQILMASSEALQANNQADIWDSGYIATP